MRAATEICAIAFDLDETLCPREQAFWCWVEAECVAVPDHTVDRARVAELDAHGRGPKSVLFDYLAEALSWREPDFASRQLRFIEGCAAALTPDPALLAMLARLGARYPLAVVSNGTGRAQRRKLDKLALGTQFDPVLISEEVGFKKPAREIFDRLLDAWRVPPETILFVGDHPEADVLAARAVGMTPVWISAGRAWPRAESPPISIGSVHQLESLLSSRSTSTA